MTQRATVSHFLSSVIHVLCTIFSIFLYYVYILPVHVARTVGKIAPKRLVYKDCYFVDQKFKMAYTAR